MIQRARGKFLPDDLGTRIGRRLRALHTRMIYRLGLPDPVPGEAGIAEGFCHPVDARRRSVLIACYRDLFPDGVRAELDEARRLIAHHFTLLGHTVDHDERIAWSRDPVSGCEWSRDFSPDIPYRGPGRLGDVKLPWELNKHQYFFTLGKAAWLTDDPGLSDEIVRQIDYWIDDNPYNRGINWIDALQVGTRAISWIMAYPFYADRCDASFRRRLSVSLAQHMLFVESHISRGRFANNHLIGEAAALVAGGLFLDYPRSRQWIEMGLAFLEEEMKCQVTPDGVHAERSFAYHRFILDHYHLVDGLLAAHGRALPVTTRRGMERMTDFLMDVLWPDGNAPLFGDGDDARGLWFRADCPADYRSLLALGAVLFGRGDFKQAAGGLTEEVFWLLGTRGATRFMELPARHPDHTSAAYPDGGYFVMRGGWGVSDPVLVFDCGPLGHGPAAHGHADALSFQLYAGGYPFLVDSGTYSYNLDYTWRDAFRSTMAHNTVIVDGLDQSAPGDRMSWQSMAVARSHRWVTTHWFDLVDGDHEGYCRLPDPVMHRRVVIFVKPDTWWVWDQLDGSGRHSIEVLLHLRPDCAVRAGRGESDFVLQSPEGATLYTWMMGGSGEAGVPEILSGSEEERSAWFSPRYGTRVPGCSLRVRRDFVGQCAFITCFSTSDRMTPTLMKQDGAIEVAMRRGDKQTETFFYRVRSDSRPEEEGVSFDGEILYRCETAGVLPVLWAGNFRELSIAGLVKVNSQVPVDSLFLEGDRCEMALVGGHENDLQVTAREGVRLVINGRLAQVSAMESYPAEVKT